MPPFAALILLACALLAPAPAQEPSADAVAPWVELARAPAWELPAEFDFSADPICTVDGSAVTQRDFTRWIALSRGAPLLEAQWLRLAGAQAADEPRDWLATPGTPVAPAAALDESGHAAVFEAWCRSKGLEPEVGAEMVAQTLRLPRSAALAARRASLDAVIGFFAGRGDSAEPPPSTRALLTRAGRWQEARPLLALLEQWRSAPGTPGGIEALLAASEPLVLYLATLRSEEKLRTTATFLDHDLGDTSVAVIAPAWPSPQAPVDPPWSRVGVLHIDAGPIAAAVRPALSPAELLAELRAYLALRRVRAAASAPEDATRWRAAVEAELRGQRALLSDEAVALRYDGFPTPAIWRAWRQAIDGTWQARFPTGEPTDLVREFAARAPWASASAGRALKACVFDAPEPAEQARAEWERGRQAATGTRAFHETRYDRLVNGSSAAWRAQAELAGSGAAVIVRCGSEWLLARRDPAAPIAWASELETLRVLQDLAAIARLR